MDIETENRAVLVMINQADQFYREQQRLAKTLRKGFLDLAKARSAVGPSCKISALDCREELQAQFLLSGDDIAEVSMTSLEACDAWRKRKAGADLQVAQIDSLRRRGNETTEGAVAETPDETPADTVLLFTGLAPPTLRKAKREFVNALTHAIKLANAIQRIQAAEAKLRPVLREERFAV
ncbi:hypothetical protein CTAYLR_001040 [Chrysophaeum taylorii]|uniref:Vacuolar ATPase assembly protein VMA22 n=1 Tax=Chrysophaeum taylorii TaxID=2483200 RepID=A0AAD7UHV3_9STRA|nr:hypothetical protein CTAYLR_001040 [Chrysophaeum taylorii]